MAKYDGQHVREFEVSNTMVSGDDSAKKGTQLSLIEESFFLPQLLLISQSDWLICRGK